mmetsp:Transcript_153000/g.490844  ORF Transcript_153000/g.490844 Transcript_153000/m.490844 type:complete len:446 (-) Transcript_153000:58-1395(-)
MAPTAAAELTAEFVGTFLLIFTIGCNVLSGNATWGGVSIASVLMVCIYALGGISGAHFNPAVSLALALNKTIDKPKAIKYSVVQLVAGCVAGLCYSTLFGDTFNLTPAAGFGWIHTALAEILYTFMLCFVVLNVAVAKKCQPNQYYGLAIGFVIVAGAYGAGAISGGCFNLAVALGIDLASMGIGFGWCIAYIIFEVVGAVLAVEAFKLVRPDEAGGEVTPATALISEFIGTFFLVLTVGLNVMGESHAGAFSIAASLMCMIYALGDVSGAHFNPAVTLAIFASGRCPDLTPPRMGMYMGSQIAGGICAAMTYSFMHYGDAFELGPGEGFDLRQALISEAIFTFVLCYVVLTVAVARVTNNPVYFGLAIGACVTVGGNAIGAISGGSLNPAVSFGIASAHTKAGGKFAEAIFYTAAELVGAAGAAVVFEVTHAVDKAKDDGALTV